MTSNTVPIYRHGRKFYVSKEEYDRIRSEERLQRQISSQKSQNLPVSNTQQTPTRSTPKLYIPLQRSQSNPSDYRYGVLRKPHIPENSINNTTRPSRPILRNVDNTNMLTKTRAPNTRSNSFEKTIDIRRTPISFDDENNLKRSLSQERSKLITPPSTQKSPNASRRPVPVPTTISDYGIGPTTTISLTSNEQSHGQTNSTALTNYFARMQQSNLNPPSKSLSSAASGTGSFIESGVQGSNHGYTVLGSTNRRPGKPDFYHQDTVSSNSLSEENSASLLTIFQRRNAEATRSQRPEYTTEFDDDSNQQRDLWSRSTIRSRSSDGLTEKKRVRFADMEGLTLETIPNRNQLKSPAINRLLTRRQHAKVLSDSYGQAHYYPTTTLVTDV